MGCIRIERAQNGYTVTVRDPKIMLENEKPNSKWRDADREFIFDDLAKAERFIEKVADVALPKEEHTSSFDKAFAEATAATDKED
jgi:hypothetical protein